MKDMNITNLNKTVEYLKTLPSHHFNMRHFREDITSYYAGKTDNNYKNQLANGTACIIGNATSLEPLGSMERFRFKTGEIDFIKWSEYFYGCQYGSNEWEYLFSEKWSEYRDTNTTKHAIERLENIIDGYVPEHITDEVLNTQLSL